MSSLFWPRTKSSLSVIQPIVHTLAHAFILKGCVEIPVSFFFFIVFIHPINPWMIYPFLIVQYFPIEDVLAWFGVFFFPSPRCSSLSSTRCSDVTARRLSGPGTGCSSFFMNQSSYLFLQLIFKLFILYVLSRNRFALCSGWRCSGPGRLKKKSQSVCCKMSR